MTDIFKFDMQLFADELPADTPPQDTPPDNQPPTDGSILGGNPPETPPATQVPEVYELQLPEGTELDQSLMEQFTGVAKEAGLSNDMANKMAGMHFDLVGKAVEAVNNEISQERNSWAETAKQELGSNFNSTVQTAAIGVEFIEKQISGIREAFNKTGFGNTVEGIRLMEALGKLVQEDPANRDLGGGAAGTAKLYTDMNL